MINGKNIPDSLDIFQQSLERCMDASEEVVYMLEKLNSVDGFQNGVQKTPEPEAIESQVEKMRAPIKVMFMETQIDKIAGLLEKSGSASLEDVMEKLKLKEECANRWCHILERRGVITIDYPVFGKPVIKLAKDCHDRKHPEIGNGRGVIRPSSVLPNANRMTM